jgi:hypothetical protein
VPPHLPRSTHKAGFSAKRSLGALPDRGPGRSAAVTSCSLSPVRLIRLHLHVPPCAHQSLTLCRSSATSISRTRTHRFRRNGTRHIYHQEPRQTAWPHQRGRRKARVSGGKELTTTGARANGGRWRYRMRIAEELGPLGLRRDPHRRSGHN